MVELLRVHVVYVGVPFDGVVPCHDVEVAHSDGGVGSEDGRSGEEFVEVAGDDDVCGGVGGQDALDECLKRI